ncbi:ATP-binding protein [bacterium]|nr:ATP-binding protein [bacterium]
MSNSKLWNIQLRVPAEPEFLGVVRLACAGISHRIGLEHELAEDFKLAATEACGHLLNLGSQEIEILWDIARDNVTLQVQAVGEIDEDCADDAADLEWQEIGLILIRAVMDEVEELTSPPGLRLTKRTVVHDD